MRTVTASMGESRVRAKPRSYEQGGTAPLYIPQSEQGAGPLYIPPRACAEFFATAF